ncbi:PLP-dependent transferase [Gloeopeniophorella convolvens]|nr:PLP-dependent transferase [Gloeopeniophorella convolvens]
MSSRTPLKSNMHEAVSAWFLGPRAENFGLLQELFETTLKSQDGVRNAYSDRYQDPKFITSEMQVSASFKDSEEKLRAEFGKVLDLLNRYSIPFFSPRYAGHMCMEMSLPSIVGWVSTIMFNPNNVAFEASPITTVIELEVGRQLCEMLGYTDPNSWGHLPSDGTIANLESMWAARNLKFYPLALRAAMEDGQALDFIASTFKVFTCANPYDAVLLKDVSTWDLLNFRVEETLGMGDRIREQYGVSAEFLDAALEPFIIQSTGKDALITKFGIEEQPQYLVSSTKHYSWPKSAAILGIGRDNCVNVPVDENARVGIDHLREKLEERFKKQQAVYAVVAIIGSTEEGAVDPLTDILALRKEFQAKGMSFVVHADAAWGGYFASMIREKPLLRAPRGGSSDDPDPDMSFVPSVALRESTVKQFEALQHVDSITIDPHKAGYIPYPAGGLCYRDGRMRYLLTWTAPYLHDASESIGSYGVEGSKPGAPSVACYLHHQVIGLHKEGHGALLGQVSFTCRRISAEWAAMSDAFTPYIVVPFNPLVQEPNPEKVEEEKQLIREHILGKENQDVVADEWAMEELRQLGSDLNINAFTCNFRIDGKPNEDVEEANYLNNRIFDRLSVTSPGESPFEINLFLSATVFAVKDYGDCVQAYKQRLGLETDSEQDLFVLRNVVMSPFQSAGDFLSTIAKAFKDVLEEEVANVIQRNTLSPQRHTFTMQGTDKIYLVYRPLFRKANGRFQLILSAQIANAVQRAAYTKARAQHPSAVYTLATEENVLLSQIEATGTFTADITGKGLNLSGVEISGVQIVKNRPLNSRWRDPVYPRDVPFYLYGTPGEQHIDHMLLRAPNAQLSADRVKLQLDKPLALEELRRGVILTLDRREVPMQPFSDSNPPSFFHPGAKFAVAVYHDPHDADAHGPGLASVDGVAPLSTGTLEIGSDVYIDYKNLNKEDFTDDNRIIKNYTSAKAPGEIKALWKDVVLEGLAA